jgi:hypothetical protein
MFSFYITVFFTGDLKIGGLSTGYAISDNLLSCLMFDFKLMFEVEVIWDVRLCFP